MIRVRSTSDNCSIRITRHKIFYGFAHPFALIVGFPLGLVAGLKQNTLWDNASLFLATMFYGIPNFVMGIFLILIFAVKFKAMGWPYLPTGADIWDPKDPAQMVRHLVLPVTCLVFITTAGYSRYIRSSILEVLGQDYVRTARAKGLSSRSVLFKHALRNAILPFVTIIGLDIENWPTTANAFRV